MNNIFAWEEDTAYHSGGDGPALWSPDPKCILLGHLLLLEKKLYYTKTKTILGKVVACILVILKPNMGRSKYFFFKSTALPDWFFFFLSYQGTKTINT